MQKTILNLNRELSIIIISGIAMVFTFLNTFNQISNVISLVFVVLKSLIFLLFPLYLYVVEKEDLKFKKVAGIYTSYFIVALLISIISSMLNTNIVVPQIWDILFGLINLIILLSSILICIEQILNLRNIKSIIYMDYIVKIVYLVGNYISYPFLKLIDKQVNKIKN